jgi:hypothetical protein
MKDRGTVPEQFPAVFAALKAILKQYEPRMVVQTDEPARFEELARLTERGLRRFQEAGFA